MKGWPGVFIFIISIGMAALTASKLVGQIRVVDVLTLFGFGFAAGAGLIGAILRNRYRKTAE